MRPNRSVRRAGRLLAGAALLLALKGTALSQPSSHPFSVHDMLAMERISDYRVSPKGDRVVFTLRTTDLDQNRGSFDLWMVGVDGTGLRRLTTHPASDQSAAWDPSGAWIWFQSTRSGSSQVWKIPADGGEAVQVTDLPVGVNGFALSPDGTRLILALEVFPDCPDLKCTADRLAAEKARKSTGQVYDSLFVRHWDTWKDGRRSHLFVQPSTGGDLLDLMRGMDADCPSKPFGGMDEVAVSPDGTTVVFAARVAGREEAWSTNFDLYRVPIDGSAAPSAVTADNPAWDTGPAFSPDGKWLAYRAMTRAGFEADRYRVMVRSWPDGTAREVAPAWDRSPDSLLWSADGKTLFTVAQNLGQVSLFGIDVASGEVKTLVRDGSAGSPEPARDRLVFGLNSLVSPVELYSVRVDGGDLRPVTRINRDRLAAARMGDFEQFTFSGWNGEKVYAYVVKPVDFREGVKYPVAFLIHGGPQGSFGNQFHYRWNPQAYAGAGYAAVMVDFHGSTGYGQAFTDSISGDWGGKPLEDLKLGLAAALQRYPWMDGDRVGALGASYGGYMINWIAGNWPDRFRCLINHDGTFDERISYYSTEELWFPEWENGGTPWDNPEGYEGQNPARFVDRWQTPMLVIHGALDFRVVLEQGLSTFTALQRRGIPSRFLYFPDENHWVLKPHNSILWHETVLGWLDQWLK